MLLIICVIAAACFLLFLAQRLPLQAPIPLIIEAIIVVVTVFWLLGHYARLG